MMKKQLLKSVLLLTVLSFSLGLKAQWIETFDEVTLPNGWDIINVNNDKTWKFDMSGDPAGHALMPWQSDLPHDDYLVTPQISVEAGVNDFLEFRAANESATFTDTFYVVISTGGKTAGDFTTIIDGPLAPEGSSEPGGATDWYDYAYDLSAYVGEDVYIAFHAVTPVAQQNILKIDDVEISGAPACSQPSSLSASNITSNSADLAWTENGTATKWEIEYGEADFVQGSPDGTVEEVLTTPAHTITIPPNNDYEFYVRSECGPDEFSGWVGPFAFTNKYCDYSNSTFNTPSHIETFKTNSALVDIFNINSGEGTEYPGYSDFTDMVLEAFATQDINFELLSNEHDSYSIAIFVDWDNDFVFDASDKIYSSDSYVIMPLIDHFTIPSGTPNGQYRMRVVSEKNLPDANACNGASAEAEDYTLEIVSEPSCLSPSNLNVTNINYTTATLEWTDNGNASAWNVEYGPVGFVQGSPDGNLVNGHTSSSLDISGLEEGTEYEFYVQSICGSNDHSSWNGPYPFATPLECIIPSGLTITDIGLDSVVVSWTGSGNAVAFEGEYAEVDFTIGNGSYFTSNNNSVTINGLTMDTEYDIYLWSNCGNGVISDTLGPISFTTDNCKTSGEDISVEVCKNEPVFLDTILSDGADLGGVWIDSGEDTLTSSEITLFDVGGTYYYSYYTNAEGCPEDIATISIVVNPDCDYLSISNEEVMEVAVYPNPVKNQLTIVNPSNASSLKVEMFDMNGRVVLVENEALANASEATLNIEHLEKGIYTLRIHNDEGQKTFKMVKQ